MQIETLTIQPIAPARAVSCEIPDHALAARAARWLSLVTSVLAATAVLLASALAVVMNLS
jgi:hypothetical protein